MVRGSLLEAVRGEKGAGSRCVRKDGQRLEKAIEIEEMGHPLKSFCFAHNVYYGKYQAV
jgi:hypothetical protein